MAGARADVYEEPGEGKNLGITFDDKNRPLGVSSESFAGCLRRGRI